MGFLEVLTIIFIVLKLIGVITWSWLICFAPLIISLIIYVIIIGFHIWLMIKGDK